MFVLTNTIAPSPKTGTKETRLEQTNQEQGRDAPSCCRSTPENAACFGRRFLFN